MGVYNKVPFAKFLPKPTACKNTSFFDRTFIRKENKAYFNKRIAPKEFGKEANF
ncbi:unknown [[Mannheimia] succiniciproducens MBEL55E]|uniref:Uncharacterized protein n=1 Tax=Mannheimia succiniciproducens (strain KCTC 0769BP / MBEL55E) TaxID=221988 RepID=Q65SR0_MANSM|nr:unknown [[Mannheimia] succiniciproducens MBEL55E]